MLHRTVAALLLTLTITAGCSMTHSDPENPKKNPHPVKRYEVTVTADAPGSWDAVKGYSHYKVVNPECTPKNDFIGVHLTPKDIEHEIEMTRVDEKTWKGYFYRDFLQDQDYFDLGVCHWDGSQIASIFIIHGIEFGSSKMVDEAIKTPQTTYFKKSDFLDRSPKPYGVADFSSERPEYVKNPDDFFPITITVKDDTP